MREEKDDIASAAMMEINRDDGRVYTRHTGMVTEALGQIKDKDEVWGEESCYLSLSSSLRSDVGSRRLPKAATPPFTP